MNNADDRTVRITNLLLDNIYDIMPTSKREICYSTDKKVWSPKLWTVPSKEGDHHGDDDDHDDGAFSTNGS